MLARAIVAPHGLARTSLVGKHALQTAGKRLYTPVKPNRPLSPHLTIYNFELNAITSVFFRGTGIALTGGIMGFSVFYAMGLINPKTFTKCIANSAIAPIVKFGVAFPLIYHWMGGMRHLSWDHLVGHNLPSVFKTGRIALATSLVLSTGLAFIKFKKPANLE